MRSKCRPDRFEEPRASITKLPAGGRQFMGLPDRNGKHILKRITPAFTPRDQPLETFQACYISCPRHSFEASKAAKNLDDLDAAMEIPDLGTAHKSDARSSELGQPDQRILGRQRLSKEQEQQLRIPLTRAHKGKRPLGGQTFTDLTQHCGLHAMRQHMGSTALHNSGNVHNVHHPALKMCWGGMIEEGAEAPVGRRHLVRAIAEGIGQSNQAYDRAAEQRCKAVFVKK
eukprot:scaffold302446_cov18-Tisochrysis_lutea.AAC.1